MRRDHSDAELVQRLRDAAPAQVDAAIRGYAWLLLAVLVGWLLVAIILALTLRLVEVLRA